MIQHVAIIMDGNGRWATARRLSRTAGHRKGVEALKSGIQFCIEKKIPKLTVWAFGKDNWKRPSQEVRNLFRLILLFLKRDIQEFHEKNIRLKVIGDRSHFQPYLIDAINSAEQLTRDNTALQLNVAIDYSGRWDIQHAVQTMLEKSETQFEPYLSLYGQPEPDLLIRTGGVSRLSNFLIWDLVYTELYFTPVLFPDFSAEEFEKALQFFAAQERRFGATPEQVQKQIEKQSEKK